MVGVKRVVRSVPVLEFSVRLMLALALLLILQGALPLVPARAVTMRFVDVDDIDDDQPGDGCTLREAITVANYGREPGTDPLTGCKISETGAGPPFFYTLNLPSYKYRLTGAAGEDLNSTGDLDIRANITLKGMGTDKTVIIGNDVDRVLHIAPPPTSGYTVNLEDITITDGGVAGWGGGIFHRASDLTISNCRLSKNTASGVAGGGALIIESGTVDILDSTLTGNQADFGGAIYNGAGTLTIRKSTLSNNHAIGGGGGAIDNSGNLSISYSEIRGNDATDSGGGINNEGELEIVDTIIADNEAAMSAGGGGGGIYHAGDAYLRLLQVTISENRVTRPGEGVWPGGGGLYVAYGAAGAVIDECTFSHNASDWESGGLHVEGGDATLRDTEILSNTAHVYAGLANKSWATLGLYRCTISDNEAESVGGLYNGGQLTIGDSTISGNRATSNDVGGIHAGGEGVLIMYRSTIANNMAARDGGGIYARDNALLRLSNCTLSGNHAARNGGGLHNTSVDTISRLSFVTIYGNEADSDGDGTGDGGGVYHGAGTVRVKNSLIAGNTDPGGEADDCSGTLTFEGENILKEHSGCTHSGPGLSIGGLDPRLGDLADNGGPTLTHMLRFGSPAIDRVTDCTDLDDDPVPADQRAVTRPHFEACDIGAVEWNPNLVFLPVIIR